MTDPVLQYDAFAAIVREKTAAIHSAVRAYPEETWITRERIELAQRMANRLHEVLKEFNLEEVQQ